MTDVAFDRLTKFMICISVFPMGAWLGSTMAMQPIQLFADPASAPPALMIALMAFGGILGGVIACRLIWPKPRKLSPDDAARHETARRRGGALLERRASNALAVLFIFPFGFWFGSLLAGVPLLYAVGRFAPSSETLRSIAHVAAAINGCYFGVGFCRHQWRSPPPARIGEESSTGASVHS